MQTDKNDKNSSEGFLANKRILIIDSSKSFSAMIQRAFYELGVKPGMVKVASDDRIAREYFELEPQIIVSEYRVGNISGFTYSNMQKKIYPEINDRIFIVVTGSANESSIVEAADEEADGFLLKPFSADKMMETLRKVISSKEKPSKYARAVSAVKKLVDAGQFDEALKLARLALKISDNPASMHSYIASVHNAQGDYEAAVLECNKGLEASQSHYRCLRVKLSAQEGLGDDVGALETLNRFLNAFPAGPELLQKAFDLAVETERYDELQEFYEDYKAREDRPQELTNSVCRALFRAATASLKNGKSGNASEFFRWCIVSSGRSTSYVEKAVSALLKEGLMQEAEASFKLYPSDQVGSDHHAQIDFLISKSVMTPDQIIEKGRQLIAKGVVNLEIYAEVIQRMKEMGRRVAAENIAYEAMRKLPDDKESLQKLVG